MTKTAGKNIPFGATHTYVTHIREYPPPPRWGRAAQTEMLAFSYYFFECNPKDMWMAKNSGT